MSMTLLAWLAEHQKEEEEQTSRERLRQAGKQAQTLVLVVVAGWFVMWNGRIRRSVGGGGAATT